MTQKTNIDETYTVFHDAACLAKGPMAEVSAALKKQAGAFPNGIFLCFNDASGEQVDLVLRNIGEMKSSGLRRGRPPRLGTMPEKRKKAGRPSMGVVAREITLLPRHWDWLGKQPATASSVIRDLVDEAIRAGGRGANARMAMARTDRFMSVALGDQPGYEEASRALYRGNKNSFESLIEKWPNDLKIYALELAQEAFIED